MSGLFENGNGRVVKLTLIKLGLGCFTVALIQIQGYLPSLDWLNPKTLKIISFSFALVLTLIKAGEMFFQQAIALFKGKDPETGNTETITKP
jgi:hypothetical protein